MVEGPLKSSVKRVEAALEALGVAYEIRQFDSSARSAEEAAAAIGCLVDQIVKSLIFRAEASDRSVLVVASGSNRVDEKALGALLGEKIKRADADFVRRRTGFAIGGVPPLAHDHSPEVFIDRDLLAFESVWAAAGTPNSVVRLRTEDLERVTGGRVVDVKQT
jgi:Cys-tRNA(Pro) deacylase